MQKQRPILKTARINKPLKTPFDYCIPKKTQGMVSMFMFRIATEVFNSYGE